MPMLWFLNLVIFFIMLWQFPVSHCQQPYVNNEQLDCYNNSTVTHGFACNGVSSTCPSYLTFRSSPPDYDTAASIASLLSADPSLIAQINNISIVEKIPMDTVVIVPVNCSCSSHYYQHNSSYVLKTESDNYYILANLTLQGLTTCQSLIDQNPYDSRELSAGMRLVVPLWCACPTANQTARGAKYLISYLTDWDDYIESIAEMFGVDPQMVFDANQLTEDSVIYPFTPILVPLENELSKIQIAPSPPPPPSPEPPPTTTGVTKSSKKWVFVGVGIGAGLLLPALSGFVAYFFHRRSKKGKSVSDSENRFSESAGYKSIPENKPCSVSSAGIQYAIGSFTVYEFEELQNATGFFSEANRIKGSVYRGSFKGDDAAIKMMRGDVSSELNILKQINHSNVIRLSGLCLHEGNTYLVYEYAENGSLSDWLHLKKYQSSFCLGWKQRVQIANDVADALNYLHNYTNPPYIHKDLKSSNILLDGNLRGKVANFGLARTVENQEKGGLQLTAHVVGTQGYMAPEYIENGMITPKLDVFAFGVVILELLSGREAASSDSNKKNGKEELLSASISQVFGGENVREKLRGFVDPSMRDEYPLDLAYSMAQLANNCVAYDPNSRPTMSEVSMTLSKILSSSMD
ncbi:hypothetical protein L1049_020883 [Liquidambar formosana]|uniref:Protein kinase domain-containing protein n=1 Tax=Liquidambar formosana TaxID=63359 RepID=A0AAP0S9T7_LIQFO